jgi:site-specific recombinase XerD
LGQQTGETPSTLDWADLDAEMITAFLDHLKTECHNNPRTRNLRLTAIRSLFTYAALRDPEHATLIQRVLANLAERFDKQLIAFRTAIGIDALLADPDRARWEGRRDRVLLLLAPQTGLRLPVITAPNRADIYLAYSGDVILLCPNLSSPATSIVA